MSPRLLQVMGLLIAGGAVWLWLKGEPGMLVAVVGALGGCVFLAGWAWSKP